jgi:hypothetical protein
VLIVLPVLIARRGKWIALSVKRRIRDFGREFTSPNYTTNLYLFEEFNCASVIR